jgi:drug/metabolite transporter (DMT)-like permease
VRVTAELLTGHHLPPPQLDRPRRVGGADDRAGAAGRAAPQDTCGVRVADPDGRLAAHVDQLRDGNPERVAEAGQGGQVRVRAPLFDRDEHALADSGARGELVQRPAAIRAQRPQGPRHGGRDVGYVRHNSFPVRPVGRYDELNVSILRPMPDFPEDPIVVTILALAAAMLYGTADFLGGLASRRASVFAVLALTVPAGAAVMLVVALLGQVPALGGLLGHGGLGSPAAMGDWSAAGWAAASGVCGAAGLIAFYAGFASAPISVVAPVAALVSAVLPVGVAVASGERPARTVIAGGLICLVAIVMVSAQPADHPPREPDDSGNRLPTPGRLRALGYGAAAGAGFGLFFIFLKNAGQSGVLWPVAISRSAGTVVALALALATRTRPRLGRGGITGVALISGAIDAAANVCYILATRAGLFGLAVVITSLYPGITVLLARVLLRERMRWLQRAGLLLAAVGVVLVTV